MQPVPPNRQVSANSRDLLGLNSRRAVSPFYRPYLFLARPMSEFRIREFPSMPFGINAALLDV